MNQLTVWVLQTGEPLHSDAGNPRPMRAMNLADALTAAGHRVVLWSSVFYHQERIQRVHPDNTVKISDLLEIRLIPSPGYKRNIGFDRLIDHWILGVNIKKALNSESEAPDVAFIGYPPIEAAAEMGKWLERRNVPFLLDVKDLWPSVFLEAVPRTMRPLGKIALAPYFALAKRCVSRATGVSAMADSFLDKILDLVPREKCARDGVFFLTSKRQIESSERLLEASDWWDTLGVNDDGKFRVCYIGNLSPNVDLTPIREAAEHFLELNIPVEFVICGNGVSHKDFRASMAGLVNVKFPGRIDNAQIAVLAQRSHAALIPYVNVENFQLSLPNKSIDSLALGLPILSPLEGEVANLISEHAVGLQYGSVADQTLSQCIHRLFQDPFLQQQMADNALALYRENFSFDRVYGGLVRHLEMLSESRLK